MSAEACGTKDVEPENITLGEATQTSPRLAEYLIEEIGHDTYVRLPNNITFAQIKERYGIGIETLIGLLNQ